MKVYITLLAAETVAELCLRAGQDSRWDKWYDPDTWDGIHGFHSYVIGIAQDLEAWVNKGTLKWGEDIDWYLTCDQLLEGIFNNEHISPFTIADFVFHFDNVPVPVKTPTVAALGKAAWKLPAAEIEQLRAELSEFAVQDELPDTIRALLL